MASTLIRAITNPPDLHSAPGSPPVGVRRCTKRLRKCPVLRKVLAKQQYAHEMMPQGAPLNESDHCGDPPLLLAAGNGAVQKCPLLLC